MNLLKRLSLALAVTLGLAVAPAATANAYTYCGPAPNCAHDLNLSTAKPYYLMDTHRAQYWLWNYGWNPGPQDGRYGAKTRDAVILFQRYYGLAPDGVVGPHTWTCLQLCPYGWRPFRPA
ncbi:peptidoglycan-binding domain-containing protein [Thalassiella azotivora]